MYPILLKIGSLSIYTYGFFIAVSFIVGILLAKQEARRLGENQDKIMDLCFYVLIAAIAGSRLFYVLVNPDIFISDPLEVLRVWNGGLVFYGGFVGALAVGLIYLKKQKMSILKTLDISAPALALAHFFGRIGCFFAGCCYGDVCDLPWAVTFTSSNSLAPVGIPLHPTQIYSSLSNLSIFGFLWFFRTRKKFDGQLFWVYVLLYGIARSFIEVFRGDFRGRLVFGLLSTSQVIGGILIVTAVVMLILLGRRTAFEQKAAKEYNH